MGPHCVRCTIAAKRLSGGVSGVDVFRPSVRIDATLFSCARTINETKSVTQVGDVANLTNLRHDSGQRFQPVIQPSKRVNSLLVLVTLGAFMRYVIATLTTIFAATFLVGCVSTSDVFEMGRDTYSVSATADGMRSAASARQSAFEAGRQTCAKQGKRFMMVNETMSRTRMAIDTTINVTFRCLSENDPEYARPNIR